MGCEMSWVMFVVGRGIGGWERWGRGRGTHRGEPVASGIPQDGGNRAHLSTPARPVSPSVLSLTPVSVGRGGAGDASLAPSLFARCLLALLALRRWAQGRGSAA